MKSKREIRNGLAFFVCRSPHMLKQNLNHKLRHGPLQAGHPRCRQRWVARVKRAMTIVWSLFNSIRTRTKSKRGIGNGPAFFCASYPQFLSPSHLLRGSIVAARGMSHPSALCARSGITPVEPWTLATSARVTFIGGKEVQGMRIWDFISLTGECETKRRSTNKSPPSAHLMRRPRLVALLRAESLVRRVKPRRWSTIWIRITPRDPLVLPSLQERGRSGCQPRYNPLPISRD